VNSLNQLVDPETGLITRLDIRMISQVSKAAFKDSPPAYDYRDVGVTLTDDAIGASYLSPNRSLGMTITGRPLKVMEGNLLLSARVYMIHTKNMGTSFQATWRRCLPSSSERRLSMRIRTVQDTASHL
jgi:hypothetical protein